MTLHFGVYFLNFKTRKCLQLKNEVQFGHVLCIKWDPRRLAAHTIKESKIQAAEKMSKKGLVKKAADETVTEATRDEVEKMDEPFVEKAEEAVPDVKEVLLRSLLPFGECCFCHSSGGVRIQCRRVSCARDFHAICAHQGSGHVEMRTDHFLQFHAYCDRHRDCTEDIGDLLAKLITCPVRLLVGRDDMRRFGTIAKHLLDYVSAAAVMHDLAVLIVGYCNKGLRASKNDPPDYNVKHLQVLQFFLNHVPQLEKVYALPSTPIQDFVNDTKLFRRLERTFDPPRYMATYPGPFSQQHTCNVCLGPFHERQHVFYCCRKDKAAIPHVQHWRCTKRLSNARERERYFPVTGSTGTKKKRKAISIVQNGVRKDITLPKGLPSMTDDVICGVCRAPMDARGLVGSCKEAKSLDFEKKESKFVQSGCYINSVGAKGFSYGYNASSRKPARQTDGKYNGSSTGQHVVAQQALGPPKMERINVQRTTRWLACVAQIIRLVGSPAPAASAEAIKSPLYPSNLAAFGSLNSIAATSAITAGQILTVRLIQLELLKPSHYRHTRAVEKARHEKRKRAEHEAQENREKERNRMSLEAERALKNQMLAMRNKQRQHLKASSLK
ncbi:unnamed protein product [Peronospora destructor]|uniref:Zinc finger PHD-type domain-containing protein n=1 Tax=Peronospora destructor TaxID=86335 RepID=A0AAV0V6I4_9STRA|nr:unnamed protein product [Peronospora destructor]